MLKTIVVFSQLCVTHPTYIKLAIFKPFYMKYDSDSLDFQNAHIERTLYVSKTCVSICISNEKSII